METICGFCQGCSWVLHSWLFETVWRELMRFGLLSLLMGHWIIFVAKICVKLSLLSSWFNPCAWESKISSIDLLSISDYFNKSVLWEQVNTRENGSRPEVSELVDQIVVKRSLVIDLDSSLHSTPVAQVVATLGKLLPFVFRIIKMGKSSEFSPANMNFMQAV